MLCSDALSSCQHCVSLMSVCNNAPFIFRYFHNQQDSCISGVYLASYPGLLNPAFVACSTNAEEGLVKLSHVCVSLKSIYSNVTSPSVFMTNKVPVDLTFIPRPSPSCHCLRYGKAARAWYITSSEHVVIGKFSWCLTDYMFNAWHV